MSAETSRLSIDIAKRDHKKLKMLANANGMSLKEFILLIIEPVLHPEKQPNHVTRKVMEESDNGENIIICKNAEDMFKKLGID